MATPPTVDSRSQFTLVLTQAPEVEGGQVMVTPEAFVGPGVTPAAVEQAQADATQALADASVVWVFAGQYVRGAINGVRPLTLPVVAPVTGRLTHVLAVLNATGPVNADIVGTPSIGGVPVTDGAVTIATTDAVLAVKSATPTGANAVTAGSSSVLMTWASTTSTPFDMTALLGFTRTP